MPGDYKIVAARFEIGLQIRELGIFVPSTFSHIVIAVLGPDGTLISEYNGLASKFNSSTGVYEPQVFGLPGDDSDRILFYNDGSTGRFWGDPRIREQTELFSGSYEEVLARQQFIEAAGEEINNDPQSYDLWTQNSNSLASTLIAALGGTVPTSYNRQNVPGYERRLLPRYPNIPLLEFEGTDPFRSPNCFTAETLVLVAGGIHRRIDEVTVGDVVLAFDSTAHGRGPLVQAKVSRVLRSVTERLVELEDGTRVTPEHRYLTLGGAFKSVAELLESNEAVIDAAGAVRFIRGTHLLATAENGAEWLIQNVDVSGTAALDQRPALGWKTYNLTVEKLHTYVAGGLRVHNDCIDDGDVIQQRYLFDDGAVVWTGFTRSGSKLFLYEQYDLSSNTLISIERIISFSSNAAAVTNSWRRADGQIDDANNAVGLPAIDVKFPNSLITGDQIGTAFGSSLGQAFSGGNVFAQIGASSVLSTVLGEFGHGLHIYFNETALTEGAQPADFVDSVGVAFDDFSNDLFGNLQSQSIGAISSFLVAEFSDAFDVPSDFGGQLLTSFVNNATNTMITNALEGASLFDGLAVFNEAAGGWTPGAGIVTAVGSFIGSYLAHQVIEAETTAGSIGGSIGGTLGSIIGAAAITTGVEVLTAIGVTGFIGSFGATLLSTILLPGIGAFVGVLLGTVLGDALAPFIDTVWDDWLGNNPPRTDAWVDYNPATGAFIADPQGRSSKADIRNAVVEIVGIAADLLNVYREAMGGQIVNNGDVRRYFYIWTDKNDLFRGPGGNYDNAEDCLNAGVLAMLKTLQVAGGDLYVKRAIAHSQATTLEQLNGDLQIAQDYARYLENKDIIDLLISADPNSAFAAGWVITLIRAQELGVTEWSASDFQGGLSGFFEALGLAKLGATPGDVAISIEGTTLKMEIVVGGETVRTIRIENFAAKIGYQHLVAAANGGAVAGTAGDDIWIAANTASAFNDAAPATSGYSNDILVGGAFADSINAGLGWDFVRGNAGDDLIVGGADNDSLYGDAGNDTIYGDANTGFAPIPTGTQLSDGALAGAPVAFSGPRRSWVGGTDPVEVAMSHGYVPPAQNFDEDVLSGGDGNDLLAGGAGEDILKGGAGGDTLYGDAGNDMLIGGAGADIVYGGAGFDTASYEDAATAVTVDLAAAPYHGTASDGDTLFDIEDLIGSRFGDTLLGDAFSNLIDGGAGADTIDGRGGRDTVSYFTNTRGIEINLATGSAVTIIPGTGGAAATTETDTLLNIEDAIGSRYDDRLIGSIDGGGLDGGAGNDTFILANDDVDVAGGASAYELRGGDGIDTLDFSGWSKARGVELDLGDTPGGNQVSGIEKVIGSARADRFTGGANAEIFDGGAGNDIFVASDGRDVYLRDGGDGNDILRHSASKTGLDVTAKAGYVTVNGQSYYRRVEYDDHHIYGALDIQNDDEGVWASGDQTEITARNNAIVYGAGVSYHDIFGSLAGIDQSTVNLSYDNYFYGSTNPYGYEDINWSSQLLTRAQLLAQLSSFDLVLGLKADGAYVSGTNVLSQISDTTRIEGGGLLAVESAEDKFWLGFSSAYVASNGPIGTDSNDGGSYSIYGDIATHQGTRYDFEASQAVERLGFEGSGHIELTSVKYFKDGSAAADTLTAAAGQGTWLFGGALNDVISGAEKGDILVGGADNDRLAGGAGNDQYAYWLGDGHDIITDLSGADTIVFGGGIASGDVKLKIGKLTNPADHASFRDVLPGEVPVDLKIEIYDPATHALVGSISIVDFQNIANQSDKLRFAGDYELTIFEFLEKQGKLVRPTLIGTAGNETLQGGDEGEDYYGLAGNNVLDADGGDDVFYAHGGSDVIWGDDGSDTVDYKYATGSITVDMGGSDPDAYEADGSNDDLNSIENFAGSDYADTIGGSDGANILVGRGGNDSIIAWGGDDTISGGDGNDVIDAGYGNDVIFGDRGNDTLNGGNDSDTVSYAGLTSAVTVNLQAGNAVTSFTANGVTVTETDTLTNIENVTGTDFNDTIIGGDLAGTYDGGMGDDRFVILNDDVDVAAGAAAVTLLGGVGADTLDFSGWSKPRGVSADLGNGRYNGIETLIGSALGDTLKGSARAETLIGGADADTLTGLAGADRLDGGSGVDTADYAASAAGVSVDLSTGKGTGGDAQGDVLAAIENVVGSVFGDTLVGDAAANALTGMAGNDVLTGGAGNDLLVGGAGSDTLDGGDGIDTADYSSAANGIHVELYQGSVYEDFGVHAVQLTGLSAGASLSGIAPNADGSYTLSPGHIMWLGSFLNLGGAASADFLLNVPVKLADGSMIERIAAITASVENGQLVTRVKGIGTRDTFESGANGWSNTTVTDGGSFFSKFLGRFGGSTEVSKTFSLPGNQTSVTLSIDLYEIDSWDDEAFTIYVNGQQIARETFNAVSSDNDHVSSTPLTQPANQGFASYADQKHRFTVTVPVNGTSATVRVVSALDQAVSDESFGIDNVTVVANLPADPTAAPILPRDLLAQFATRDILANVENVIGTAFGDVFSGDGGNNVLTTLEGNDYLQGNRGDDILRGGAGDDTYSWSPGDGHDIISDPSGIDKFIFWGVTANNLLLTVGKLADPNLPASFGPAAWNELQFDLRIQILDPASGAVSGSVTLRDFRNSLNMNDVLRFADGSEISVVQLLINRGQGTHWGGTNVLPLVAGTEGNDTLTGSVGTDEMIGFGGNDIINAGDGNDIIYGGGGADTINGGAGEDYVTYAFATGPVTINLSAGTAIKTGNVTDTLSGIENATGSNYAETITGSSGANVIYGADGADVINGGSGNDTLYGSDGDDQIFGQNDVDLIYGDRGNDLLDGGAHADTLIGGLGNDTYVVENAGDIVTELGGEGTDTVQSSVAYALGSNVENLTLTGSASIAGTGNALANVITGNSGANSLDGGAGADTLIGGLGDDIYIVDASDTVVELLGQGTDTVQSALSYTLGNDVENLTLTGSAGVNGTGNALANTLTGNAGANILDGGAGNDTMIGGAGDDTYIVDSAADAVTEAASAGIDIILSSASIATLAANVENLTLTGSAAINGTGNGLDNVITGNSADNTLSGAGGNDHLRGAGGNDRLAGGAGADIIDGGAGGDNADYTASGAAVTIDLAAGIASGGDAAGDSLVSIEHVLGGAFADSISGNAEQNFLRGGSGDDVIVGRTGDDFLYGDAGNDQILYNLGDGHDIVDDLGGVDKLVFGSGFTAANLVLTVGKLTNQYNAGSFAPAPWGDLQFDLRIQILDPASGTVSGSVTLRDFRNSLNMNDVLRFADGSEISVVQLLINRGQGTHWNGTTVLPLWAGTAGNDTLTGGASTEEFIGFDGNDTMIGNAGGDVFYAQGGADAISGGEGEDWVDYSLALGSVTVNLSVGTAIEPGAVTDSLSSIECVTGSTFGDIITGNSAANILSGGGGNDVINGGSGNDTLVGSDGEDQLFGQNDVDLIYGDRGNDLLDGGAQADTLIGGLGDDTYVVENAGDIVTELAGEGADTVQSSIAYALGSNVENLTLTGSASIAGTGNTLANVIAGNSGANTLDGGAGADTLIGGLGDDIYVVDASDTVLELAGQGTDTVQSALSYTLGNDFENLTLTGSAGVNGTGNALANTLTGNTGANILDGGAGNDTMIGGAGDDTYFVDSTSDIVTEAASAGTDTIRTSVTLAALATNVENLTLIGTAAINATGNTLNNVLAGNAANNTLSGGAGADTMSGGGGDDIYIVENAGDIVTELAGQGTDGVQSSVAYTLSANVENLTLTGSSAINAFGNALGNVLIGNSGINILTGGTGNDLLQGAGGNDQYAYALGDGHDIVTDLSGADKLVFGAGINATELVFRPGHLDDPASPASFRLVVGAETPTDLRIDILDPVTRAVSGSITIVDFRNSANAADLIRYGNGTETTIQAAMQAQGVIVPALIVGTEGDDELYGGAGNDDIRGLGGDDYIVAGSGNNIIRGGPGDDWIEDDFTPGNDQYNFGSGDHFDIIYDSGGTDSLRFDPGINPADLWFMREYDDLVIGRFGSGGDAVVIGAWFEAPGYQIETISVANGQNLQAGEVNSLISQMAAFAAQVGGDPWGMQATDLPPDYQVAVNSVWQAS